MSQRHNTITNIVRDEVRLDDRELKENTHADVEENVPQIDKTDKYMTINNCNGDNNEKRMVRKTTLLEKD